MTPKQKHRAQLIKHTKTCDQYESLNHYRRGIQASINNRMRQLEFYSSRWNRVMLSPTSITGYRVNPNASNRIGHLNYFQSMITELEWFMSIMAVIKLIDHDVLVDL